MRKRKTKKKTNKFILLLIILLGLSLGYAAISTTLKVIGKASLTKRTWNVHWGNAKVTEGSVTNDVPNISEDSGDPSDTKVTWSVAFTFPGQFYEFTVDAINEGGINAKITSYEPTVSPALPNYIKYTVTYADGTTPAVNDILEKKYGNYPSIKRYKVRVEYDDSIATLDDINNMTENATYTFSLDISYGVAQTSYTSSEPTGECPGPNCLYAYYTHTDYPVAGFQIGAGGILPVHYDDTMYEVTSNHNCGPTSNYNDLTLEYKVYAEYDDEDDYHPVDDYFGSYEECEEQRNSEYVCRLDRVLTIKPKIFFGHIIDNQRVLHRKYLCIIDSNELACFKMLDIKNVDSWFYEDHDYYLDEYNGYNNFSSSDRGNLIEELLEYFGEYDSNTEVGCYENGSSYECISHDKNITIKVYNYSIYAYYTPIGRLRLETNDFESMQAPDFYGCGSYCFDE